MRIIEIEALPNGAHCNQTGAEVCPAGWAEIPDFLEIPETFPYVDLELEPEESGTVRVVRRPVYDPETGLKTGEYVERRETAGHAVVRAMSPGTPPEPVPEPEEPSADTAADNRMIKAQIQAQSDRTDFLEDCIAELAAVVYG